MLQPPEQFSQLKAAQWSAPLLTGALVVMSLKSHGLASDNALMWVTGTAMVVSWVLAMQAVWGSTWGSRHQLVTVAALFLLVVMPLSTMMLPLLPQAMALPNGWLSVPVLLVLLGMLLLSAWYHARRCPMPNTNEQKVNWPPCQINMAKQTLSISVAPPTSHVQPIALTSVGAASVAIYHWLASQTSAQHMLLIGVVIALTMSAWLCLWPLGRTLGQAWRLRALEAQRGVRVHTSRIQWLQQERQRFVVGRWWQRK